ncbi:MAG: hypothetical protein HOV83_11725 [Catenulispora sp.]|nr:hypothetical protein [Catenulispora sp.]
MESFAAVFDSAVADSGLTLERLQDRLAAEGVRISLATLSYWRRGRSLPEREQSLVAVRQLERILVLKPGAPTNVIGPKASRGRWTGRPPGTLERRRLWPAARALFTEFDAPPDGQVPFWSVHDQLVLDAAGQERLLRVRMTAEAVASGVSRILVYYQSDSPAHPVPRHIDVRFCRLGLVRTDSASGLTVAELLLDHRLAQGEVAAVEYDLHLT